jgi:transketolase
MIDTQTLTRAANEARGLAIDAIHKAGIGHLGLPLGCAEIGAVLYGHALRVNPAQPRWVNRDRFVLSAGHGSMFLYAWLHLAGFAVSRDDLRKFRQLHSATPGHPEFGETPGVESTTGPLGQGVGNAVGMAVSLKMSAARYNTADHTIIDAHVVCLAGDGCMQEGVAMEAMAFAGHNGLDNLIIIYDSNDVTLDAQADQTQSEDAAARFAAIGFDVVTVDGHDMPAFLAAYEAAKAATSGKPQLIIAKTTIAKGIAEVEGTWKGHGEGGAKFGDAARARLGLPADEHFYVSPAVESHFAAHRSRLESAYTLWAGNYAAWCAANPALAAELEAAQAGTRLSADQLLALIPPAPAGKANATRNAGGDILQPLAAQLPLLTTGSADLFGSTKNYLIGCGDFSRDNPRGRNFRYGIREHAMGAIANGLAYDGIWITSGATFLTFSDYMRGSIRLAALSHLPVGYFFTHDSVGVGEDGPTHQPVETTSSLRLIPGLDVMRPADAEETAGAVAAAISRTDGPTALILTRQNVPDLSTIPVAERRAGTLRGAYVARAESGPLTGIIIGSGSELHLALAAADQLGAGVRVVSMPSMERFLRQPADYREAVLPAACTRRVAIEAGVTHLWYRFVGPAGAVVGIDRFGLSAPGNQVMEHLGISTPALVAVCRQTFGQ